jgi:hypothetical protein
MPANGKNGSRDYLPPPPADLIGRGAPAAQSLGTPMDFRRAGASSPSSVDQPADGTDAGVATIDSQTSQPRKQATETLAARAGALSDEVDFPQFVASLVHGTFDAIVDSSIRQMEAYADLVSAIAKPVEEFTEGNVSLNQARDWLVEQYPADLRMDTSGEAPTVVPRPQKNEDGEEEPRSPGWLKDFHAEGEELTPELIEETLVPEARRRVGHARQQTLATLVLLGLNRVVVRDGSISARLRFRAAAADKAKVDYAVSDDPKGSGSWGARGSASYDLPTTKVSTVGVNAQSDSVLSTEISGEVKINFASETLPLDRFADDARRTLLERRARPGPVQQPAAPSPPPTPAAAPPAAAVPPTAPPAATPAVNAPPSPQVRS